MPTKNQLADQFLEAVELEKISDIELVNGLLSKLSSKKLSQQGLAILNLTIASIRNGLGARTLVELENDLSTHSSDEIENGGIRVGDIVKIEKSTSGQKKKTEKEKDSLEAVVTKVQLKKIVVAIDETSEDTLLKLGGDRLWLVKVSNSITYKRIESTLRKLKEIESPSHLIRLLTGEDKYLVPSTNSLKLSYDELNFNNDCLNNSQKHAINFALQSDLSIIHGPPGTGKTYTLIELIQQLLLAGHSRVLVCGPSNISVDTIVERLDKIIPYGKLIRIGHPARLLPSIQKHSLDYLARYGDNSSVLNDIKKEINDNLKTLKKKPSYKERRQLWQDLKFLRKDLRQREVKVLTDLITNSQVVVATLHGSSSKELTLAAKNYGKPLFDCVIIDEVSQALEPQCWIPIVSHPGIKKLVLAGDNKQLPPTIKLNDHDILVSQGKGVSAAKILKGRKILETTLFDRLIQLHPKNDITQLLNVQYRMNSKIMEFSSAQFYNHQLIADDSVKSNRLVDLDNVLSSDETTESVIWYDTQGSDFHESIDLDDKFFATESKYNEYEASLALLHVNKLVENQVDPSLIGIISPYASQISLLKQKIHPLYPTVEISTIDGFQGREKEIIILSLVRSNFDKKVGFLKEERRLNVAITRPKTQLCVIGDMETLGESRVPFLTKWVKWAEENADVQYPQLEDLEDL